MMKGKAGIINIRQYFDCETSTYTYLLIDAVKNQAVIIDPVLEQMDRDLDAIEKLDLNLLGILETHVHADHITAAYEMRKKIGVLIYYGSESGVDGADVLLKDGDAIQVGQFDIKTIHTPGHTAGCVCYYTCGMLFTGDTLFIGGTGRTDFQGGSAGLLYDNVVKKLFCYPDNTIVYPAHDYSGKALSTIGEEKKWNPNVGVKITKSEFIENEKNKSRSYPKKIDIAVPANMKCGQTSTF